MKIKLPIFFLFLVCQFGYSQTEKLIKAKVFCEDFPLQGIEVLNLASKRTTITDSNGKFSILAKTKDTLMFVSKNYEYKRFFLKKEDLENNNLIISLTRKPEQLEEIVIISKVSFPKIKFDKNIANQLKLEKEANNPKPFGVYDGTIPNGLGMTINLSSGRKKTHEIEFKELMKKNYNDSFYIETLKLKPEKIGLFIEFCDADPKSKTVLENTNPLRLMDFLMSKKIEFNKILALENN
jgi:hypothetical protein